MTPDNIIQIVMGTLSNPAAVAEITLNVYFPEKKVEFQRWLSLQIQPTPAAVYDWLQKQFPEAPPRDQADSVDGAFREMSKYILARAMGLEYNPPKRIITTQGDA